MDEEQEQLSGMQKPTKIKSQYTPEMDPIKALAATSGSGAKGGARKTRSKSKSRKQKRSARKQSRKQSRKQKSNRKNRN